MNSSQTCSRGSIYVLTLLTVAAVGSMILIGVSLRTARNSQSIIIEQMSANSSGVIDAAELAIGHIDADSDWITNAQKGVVFSEFTLGDRTYSSSVVDADTLTIPTVSSTNYRVKVTSSTGLATESASVDLTFAKFDYYAYLQSLGLEAYWPLDEVAKTTNANEPQDNRDGTYQSPSAAGQDTNDENGVVPVFNGSGNHVETPYDSSYQDDTQGTVSFWMKLTGTGPYTSYGIFGQRFDSSGMPAITMTCLAGSLSAYLDDEGAFDYGHFATTSPNLIKVGQWHHVAMTWGPAGLQIYIDGTQRSGTGNTDYWDTRDGIIILNRPLIIGAGYIASSSSQPQVGFVGSIARFAILTNQLNAATIAELASIKPDEMKLDLVEDSWVKVFE